jgi:hypothetical protein
MTTISLLALLFLAMGMITFIVGVWVNNTRKQAVPIIIRNDDHKRRRHYYKNL